MAENLLSVIHESTSRVRRRRAQLAARMSELEEEMAAIRREMAELDRIDLQNAATLRRLVDDLIQPGGEAATSTPTQSSRADERFRGHTISQAAALLLKETTGPLHVDQIYQRLVAGGFRFTGQHPTISIAVSLNRHSRFRKVAPATFDLRMREARAAG